jgi:hypothetical protein
MLNRGATFFLGPSAAAAFPSFDDNKKDRNTRQRELEATTAWNWKEKRQ